MGELAVIRGEVPAWTAQSINGDGYGSGDGYGDGYGYGSGYGYGYGSGDGYGDGYGYGYGSGYGDGSGYGYGDGYGYGYGSGSGSGSGYGSGYGYGDGYGYGYGSGYGDGYGYGSGYGYGDGYGYGYGSGSGSGYWVQQFSRAKTLWSGGQRDHLKRAEREAAVIAFWKSTREGRSANGGKEIAPAAPGLTHEIDGPLRLCTAGALHATMNPDRWEGERLWVVALYGEIAEEDGKFGALKREVIGEIELCRNRPA